MVKKQTEKTFLGSNIFGFFKNYICLTMCVHVHLYMKVRRQCARVVVLYCGVLGVGFRPSGMDRYLYL